MTPRTDSGVGTSKSARSLLAPEEEFPMSLGELTVLELHVLHSRICRQLDHEYLTDPAGAHPATLDRHLELVAELDDRDTA